MRGFVGHFDEGNILPHTHHTYIYTHYDFFFYYNDDRVSWIFFTKAVSSISFLSNTMIFFFWKIIFANVSTKERTPTSLDGVVAPVELSFTYSVHWIKTK